MPRKQEIIGKKFNMLTVVSLYDRYGKKNRRRYICSCDCGGETIVIHDNITCGMVKSCGCLRRQSPPNKTHGKKNHPLYGAWQNMKNRCYNKNVPAYVNYGKRGIDVCKEWVDDFKSYYDWAMANCWEYGLEIDRIDNDKGYSPDNCRVVARDVNLSNKGVYKNNTTGVVGVSKRGERFIAAVSVNGVQKYCGIYKTIEEATLAVNKAKGMDLKRPTDSGQQIAP